jgi:excisionase family DNA binding protein
MENIIVTTPPELQGMIDAALRKFFSENPVNSQKPQPEIEYITRKETAKILGVSLPTLNEWTKKGIITGYRISSRVRYNKDEILSSLHKILGRKEFIEHPILPLVADISMDILKAQNKDIDKEIKEKLDKIIKKRIGYIKAILKEPAYRFNNEFAIESGKK